MNNENTIESYLRSRASLDCYFISSTSQIGFIDSTGKVWSILEDDDEFNHLCVQFLKSNGAPEFDDSGQEETFIRLKTVECCQKFPAEQ